MKPVKRAIIYAFFAFVWLAVIALALEVFAAIRLKQTEKNHEAVKQAIQQRTQAADQKVLDEEAKRNAENTPDSPRPSTIAPGYFIIDDDLGQVFAAFDETDRATFAAYSEILVAAFDPQGNHLFAYGAPAIEGPLGIKTAELPGKPVSAYMSDAEAAKARDAIARVYAGGPVEKVEFMRADKPYSLTLYPVKNPDGAVAQVIGAVDWMEIHPPGVPVFEMFERQWFKFKRNMEHGGFRTNNLGWRDDDCILPKPAGVYRVACIGGSCVAEGIVTRLTYPNIAETILNQEEPGRYDVINCGVHALSTAGEKKRIYDYLQMQPDLLVDYNGQNEFGNTLFGAWNAAMDPRVRKLKKSRFLNGPLNFLFIPSRAEIGEQVRNTSVANLKAINDVLKRKGVRFAVCSFARPLLSHCSWAECDYLNWNAKTFWTDQDLTFRTYARVLDAYNEELKAFCEREGAFYIPVAEELQGGTDLFVDICHMTQAGTRRKAEVVAKYVRQIAHQATPEKTQ